jgi:hypothetical protein
MPIRVPTSPRSNRGAILDEVSLCIAEAETSSSAQAAMLMVLSRTGYDASEAVEAFWVDMDALAALRSLRCHLRTP